MIRDGQFDRAVQRKAIAESEQEQLHASAHRGLATAASTLPYLDRIQQLFGRHDVTGIQAHTGADAAASARAMGAEAYASGNHVVLAGAPDLHTTAHEAAHVVQQRGGVQLKGGAGEVGDPHEEHADAVADRVVRGESAEALLDRYTGPSMGSGGADQVQCLSNLEFYRWKTAKLRELDQALEKYGVKPELRVKARTIVEQIGYKSSDSTEKLEADFKRWLDEFILSSTPQVVGGVENPAPAPGGAADDVTAQFAASSSERVGGLLLRAVHTNDTLQTYLRSIPSADASQAELKQRVYNLEKYAYIRGDTSMGVFGGRSMGLLVDPNKVTEQIRTEEGKPAMFPEDGKTGTSRNPTTTQDIGLTPKQVAKQFDALVTTQNDAKGLGTQQVGNWNEVEILSARSNAYVGLFYSWPHRERYETVFTPLVKAELAELWRRHTGQETLRIYLYKHRGSPKPGTDENALARAMMGCLGASELLLVETINCGQQGTVEASASTSSPLPSAEEKGKERGSASTSSPPPCADKEKGKEKLP